MSQIKLLLLLASLSCLSLHCKKDDPSELSKLPPITNYGAQTFGCLVNGKAWTADYGEVQIDFFNGILSITAEKLDNAGQTESVEMYTYKNQINSVGGYVIPYNSFPKALFFAKQNLIWYRSQLPVNSMGMAFITISRMDTINYYLAGTFSFTLFDETGTSQVNITEGRFDYKYH